MKNDEVMKLELKISHLLRWGVLLAGVFLLLGWVRLLDFSQNPLLAFHDYHEQNLRESLHLALEQRQWGLLTAYVGLGLLISLPLLRVLMTGILFLKEKERLLAALAFFVFFLLVLSFSLGIEL